MALITDPPIDLPTTNALDDIPDDLLDTPAAYLAFGSTPCAMDEPPAVGEVRTYIVRARCTAEHGPIERKDGEMRYTRTLTIQACWEAGKQPPNTDDNQPGLFDEAGDVNPEAVDDEHQDDEDAEDEAGDDISPAFSHSDDESE
ncbi:hypothetical protein HMPREF0591_4834 [Mycobacterium parascrofulaceum ATCC BAA-614]|uniref:Uncharacterized protein n=1 Tax=Mycobacterium parascrofulaceum ATCC BAA-614 TaxID=525368 RepID=D5PF90_9MYCO|nr:hypothetical protein [Mycobacterium parascrofulaceum]EFG75271.1 hypothetical protein HMPREF0591_4834 [Mycobacterium parascrofulaceum ATCC BAA-614]